MNPSTSDRFRRALAVLALVVGTIYLAVRLTTLGGGFTLALSIVLLLTEVWALAELGLLTILAWPRGETATARSITNEPIDVVITAHHATAEQVERSLVGSTALNGAGQVTVVDSEWRPAVATAVSHFDAKYVLDEPLRRSRVSRLAVHARSDLLLWLEAGQVPMPQVLRSLRPRFDDPEVAVCQSAIGLLNAESLVHLRGGRDDEARIRDATGPGRDRLGAGPWTGPGSLIRRAALDDVSGVVTAGPAEVGRKQVLLHRAGWTTAYDGRGLIRAAAAETLGQYLERRRDRAADAFALLHTPQNPLRVRGLAWRQRIAHLAAIEPHLQGGRYVLQLGLLLVALTTGRIPVDRLTPTLAASWLAAVGLGIVARRALGRGSMAIGDWIRHGWRTIEADLQALSGVRRSNGRPRRLRAERSPGGGLVELGRLRLLTGAVVMLDLALVARASTLINGGLLPAMSAWERAAVIALALAALVPMVDVLQVVVVGRQRRAQHRLRTTLPVRLFETEGSTVDLSPTGIGVLVDHPVELGASSPFELRLPALGGASEVVSGTATVRAISPDPSGLTRIGLELTQLEVEDRLAIMAYCVLGRQVAEDPRPLALAAPGHFSIDRAVHHHRGLQTATMLAVFGGISVLLAGPAAASGAVVESPKQVCVVHNSGSAAVGVEVSTRKESEWVGIGRSGADGCLVVEGMGDQFSVSQAEVLIEGHDRADGVMTIHLPQRSIVVRDRTGVDVEAQVRLFTDGWIDAKIEDGQWVVPSEIAPDQVEITVGDARYVVPFVGGDLDIRLSTLVAEDGFEIVETNRGAGWESFRAGDPILPGRVAVRLNDGTVIKVDVPMAAQVSLPSGVIVVLPPVETPTTVTAADKGTTVPSEPSTTVTSKDPTTTVTEPDPATSSPTSEASSSTTAPSTITASGSVPAVSTTVALTTTVVSITAD